MKIAYHIVFIKQFPSAGRLQGWLLWEGHGCPDGYSYEYLGFDSHFY